MVKRRDKVSLFGSARNSWISEGNDPACMPLYTKQQRQLQEDHRPSHGWRSVGLRSPRARHSGSVRRMFLVEYGLLAASKHLLADAYGLGSRFASQSCGCHCWQWPRRDLQCKFFLGISRSPSPSRTSENCSRPTGRSIASPSLPTGRRGAPAALALSRWRTTRRRRRPLPRCMGTNWPDGP